VLDDVTPTAGLRSSRRSLLRASIGAAVLGVGALPLLEACAPAAPAAPSPSTPGQPTSTTHGPLLTFMPFAQPGLKPDYHVDDTRYDDGYDNYPQQRFKAVADAPGSGGTLNVLITNYIQPPTPYEQNPTWHFINKQLNADMRMNIVASPDYQADLPGFAKASYDAQQVIMPLGVEDPTRGYNSPTAFGKGVVADVRVNDGLVDIILGRRPFSDYDSLVSDWRTEAGDQIRTEYLQVMAGH